MKAQFFTALSFTAWETRVSSGPFIPLTIQLGAVLSLTWPFLCQCLFTHFPKVLFTYHYLSAGVPRSLPHRVASVVPFWTYSSLPLSSFNSGAKKGTQYRIQVGCDRRGVEQFNFLRSGPVCWPVLLEKSKRVLGDTERFGDACCEEPCLVICKLFSVNRFCLRHDLNLLGALQLMCY